MIEVRAMDAEFDAAHEAAADWFARLQDPQLSLDDTLAWQSWMRADERNARAFKRIQDTWQRFANLPQPKRLSPAVLCLDRYDGSVPVSSWRGRTPAREQRGMQLGLAASFIFAAIGAAWLLRPAESRSTLETEIGENRNVQLSDGSRVALGGRTRVIVEFGGRERQLTLDRGEALFSVAKDPSRPFTVRAGSATVTAVGTEFNVRRAEDRVIVAVVEGRVLVEPQLPLLQKLSWLGRATSDKRAQQYAAGAKTTIDRRGIESSTHLPDASAAIAWQTGRLAFEREPLRYVLEDVNRYAAKPIVLGDEQTGDLRITGTVLSENIPGWIASLESAFGLRALEQPDRIVLTAR